jgi:7,8-dihydroneopterin aldolase/epimerase/oxygenase
MTGRISLEGLEFHAYHGVYAHERSSGNKFEVDIVVDGHLTDAVLQDDLSGTINYETLYALVKDEMEKPSKLLETVGYAIANRVLNTLPEVERVEIKISKFNPPIGGVCKKATVMVSQSRNSRSK